MSKRMTATEKWDDEWFQELPGKYQKLWLYICDKCDCAGIWKVNKALAEFQLRETLDLGEALDLFNKGKERVKKLSEGKWFITGFIRFQVTALKRLDVNGKINRVHAPIYASLEANGLDPSLYEIEENRGSTEALQSLLNKTKQDTNKKKTLFKKPSLEELTDALTAGGLEAASALVEAQKFLDYYETVGWVVGKTQKPMKSWRGAVSTWIQNCREWSKANDRLKSGSTLSKNQIQNIEALHEFSRTARPENLRAGDGPACRSLPGA